MNKFDTTMRNLMLKEKSIEGSILRIVDMLERRVGNPEELGEKLKKLNKHSREISRKIGAMRVNLYPTRYMARKHRLANEVTVKVEGGYTNMDYMDYKFWLKQK